MPLPLHTLPRPEQLSERPGELLYWGVDIPAELDAERIVVSMPELRSTLCHTAGMQDAVVTPTTDGVGGYQRSARGSAAYYHVHYTPEDKRRAPGMRWPTLEVALNTGMLAARTLYTPEGNDPSLIPTAVAEMDGVHPAGKPANKEALWASAVDLALRQSIRAGAREKLLGGTSEEDERMRTSANCFLGAIACDSLLLACRLEMGLILLPLVVGGVIAAHCMVAKDNKSRTGRYELRRMHWSVSGGSGIAPEMYAATVVSTAVPGLIRARK